jgi:hypothetical protein
VVVADIDVPELGWAQVLKVGDKRPVEGHEQRPTAVVAALVGDIGGAVDGHGRLARTSRSEHDHMPVRGQGHDLLLLPDGRW